MEAKYITSAVKTDQFLESSLPEITFLGRSNCGKSSLLNALMNSKSLARVSASPGRTRMVNFFSLTPKKEKTLIFADLPGWGYSSAAKEIEKLWEQLLTHYLERPQIKEFLMLLDVRRKFLDHELDFAKTLSQRASLSIVLTKTDKFNARDLNKFKSELSSQLEKKGIKVSKTFAVSVLKKKGIEELRTHVLRHLEVLD